MARRFGNLIGGEWVDGGEVRANLSPSNLDDVVGEYAQGTAADVDRAVAAARAALPGWSKGVAQARGDVLDRVGTTLLAREAELGELLAREEGKTLAEARGEVQRA
ncbi:MAG: aldehyde dehydrogenase family protein, partial [Caulobacteraceae bacterium]